MSRLFIVKVLFFMGACHEKNRKEAIADSDIKTIQLTDGLGSITINKPDQTDTFFSWIRTNDCGRSCEEVKYRFQSKALPVFKESGFYWIGQPKDSVNQLTISHHRPDALVGVKDSFVIKNYKHFKENLESDPETANIIFDTIQQVGDRYFCIFKIADVDKKTGVFIRRLIAFTFISGNELQFRYELLTMKRDSILELFFENSMENLKSARIKDSH